MEIPLTQGKVAIVDEEDYAELSKYKWSALRYGKIYYAGRGYRDKVTGKKVIVTMHRFIMNTPPGMFTDHISGDGLDNRRCNLRICTQGDNRRNAGKPKNNTSGYKGVSFSKRSGSKWVAQIRANGQNNYLGLFETKELAYEAYCKACIKYHKEFSRLK